LVVVGKGRVAQFGFRASSFGRRMKLLSKG